MTPLISPALKARHGFFTREGGVSAGPFASLNCSLSSLSSPDDPARVAENRARVARFLGAESLLGLNQVHGPEVVVAAASWPDRPRADAMVTDRPGLALGIVTADCAPVLLHDPAAGVIGAVHAGWRGALAGVLEAAVAAMQALGASRIVAAIGPCIQQPSYEVGPDLRDAILAHDPSHARFLADGRPGHWQFDLPGYCAARLAGIGQVDQLRADTFSDEARFFSHRRRTLAQAGPIGHQISAIVL